MSVEWSYDKETILGKGVYGVVYLGELHGVVGPVAVKRITRVEIASDQHAQDESREEAAMANLNHRNVLKLYHVTTDHHFKYYFLELCQATISEYCANKYTGPMPGHSESLRQMTSGLRYIHSKGFVHRDIKADNVLISFPVAAASRDGRDQVQLKISDFGLSKAATASGSFSLTSGVKGTRLYYAAELLRLDDVEADESRQCQVKGNVSSDVFALGCLFYGLLTKGKHPFSDGRGRFFIPNNIIEGKYNLNGLSREDSWALQIIEGMVQCEPTQRLVLEEIEAMLLSHP